MPVIVVGFQAKPHIERQRKKYQMLVSNQLFILELNKPVLGCTTSNDSFLSIPLL